MGDTIEEYFITMNNRNVGSAMSLVMMILICIAPSDAAAPGGSRRRGRRSVVKNETLRFLMP